MPSQSRYAEYTEALSALSSVDSLQREALRKAVEDATAAEEQARTAMAAQQRMYDRAGKDADEANRLLDEVRTMLAAPRSTIAPGPRAGDTPPLAELRGVIAEVTRWAAETKPVVESLLRSRSRLTHAGVPTQPRSTAPAPRRRRPIAIGGAVAAIVIAAVIVAVVVLR